MATKPNQVWLLRFIWHFLLARPPTQATMRLLDDRSFQTSVPELKRWTAAKIHPVLPVGFCWRWDGYSLNVCDFLPWSWNIMTLSAQSVVHPSDATCPKQLPHRIPLTSLQELAVPADLPQSSLTSKTRHVWFRWTTQRGANEDILVHLTVWHFLFCP